MHKLTHLLIAALLTCAVAPAFAGDAATPPASGTQRYGAPVTVKKPVDIAKLAKNPEKFNGKTLRLEGVVKEVCQGMGCWVEVSDGKGASFIARSLDESVLLPKDCKGRKVVVQGQLTTMPAAAAEEPVEKGHTCPRPNYVLSTQGVELAAAQ
jgi:hypothetical protein